MNKFAIKVRCFFKGIFEQTKPKRKSLFQQFRENEDELEGLIRNLSALLKEVNDCLPDKMLIAANEHEVASATMADEEQYLLNQMFPIIEELREIDWEHASQCPQDGSYFWALEADSKVKRLCRYEGQWPEGKFWVQSDDNFPYVGYPILIRTFSQHEMLNDPDAQRFLIGDFPIANHSVDNVFPIDPKEND